MYSWTIPLIAATLLSGCALTQPDPIRCEVHTYEGGGELTASGHESTAELSVLLERCAELPGRDADS